MRTLSHAHVAGESHGIDLAPMLDFVVNLLIFFIITAVFVNQGGLEVRRTSSEAERGNPSKSFVIDERGEIAIDGKTIDFRAVRAQVEQLKAVDPKSGIVVVADEDAPTGAVVAVADQIRLAGVSDITFTTTQSAQPR